MYRHVIGTHCEKSGLKWHETGMKPSTAAKNRQTSGTTRSTGSWATGPRSRACTCTCVRYRLPRAPPAVGLAWETAMTTATETSRPTPEEIAERFSGPMEVWSGGDGQAGIRRARAELAKRQADAEVARIEAEIARLEGRDPPATART